MQAFLYITDSLKLFKLWPLDDYWALQGVQGLMYIVGLYPVYKQWFLPTSLLAGWRACTRGYRKIKMADKYKQRSVQRLKCELAQRGAACGGRKIDLIER